MNTLMQVSTFTIKNGQTLHHNPCPIQTNKRTWCHGLHCLKRSMRCIPLQYVYHTFSFHTLGNENDVHMHLLVWMSYFWFSYQGYDDTVVWVAYLWYFCSGRGFNDVILHMCTSSSFSAAAQFFWKSYTNLQLKRCQRSKDGFSSVWKASTSYR